MAPTTAWVILAFGVIGGPIATYFSYTEKSRVERVESVGVETDAQVHGGQEKRGRKGSRSYTVKLSYQANGQSYSKDMNVTGSFFNSISNGDSMTVDTVKVKYLKENPDQAIVVGGTDKQEFMMWLGILGGLGAAAVGLWGVFNPTQD